MSRTLAVLLLAALAGCLGPDGGEPPHAVEAPPAEQPPPATVPDAPAPDPSGHPLDHLWGGQVLEAIDCRQTFHNAYADRDAVEARVPDPLTVPGNAPVPLVIVLLDCRSLTVGNESLRDDAWIYLTYIHVVEGDGPASEQVGYLLEFGSDWDAAWMPLRERDAPALGGTFGSAVTAGTDALSFLADDLSYTFRDAGTGPMQVQRGPLQVRLLAGPHAETALDFRVHYTQRDNLPVVGVLETDGGALNELLGPVAPSITNEASGGSTFQEIVPSR